jgi:hypothetical protein
VYVGRAPRSWRVTAASRPEVTSRDGMRIVRSPTHLWEMPTVHALSPDDISE